MRCPLPFRQLDPIADPSLDVRPSVPHVRAHAEPNRTVPSGPPRVDGLDRNLEEHREIVGGEEPFGVCHVGNRACEACREIVISLSFGVDRSGGGAEAYDRFGDNLMTGLVAI